MRLDALLFVAALLAGVLCVSSAAQLGDAFRGEVLPQHLTACYCSSLNH